MAFIRIFTAEKTIFDFFILPLYRFHHTSYHHKFSTIPFTYYFGTWRTHFDKAID